MAVTFDASVQSAQTSTVSLTVALTVASNAVLLVFFHANAANASVSAVAANGTALTQLGRAQVGTGQNVTVFGLTAPAAGTVSISANFVGAAQLWGMQAVTYTQAKAANCFGTVASGTGTTVTNVNLSVSSTTNDRVVAGFVANTDISATNGTTRLSAGANFGTFVVDIAAGSGTTSLSATLSGAFSCAFLGLSVRFSATAAAATWTPSLAMLGCGQ